MKDQVVIELQDVQKVFETDSNTVEALAQISLRIHQGEFVSMIGPSGCGKTSLMRIVGDLEKPTGGSVHVHGKIPEVARRDRLVGFVFQNPSLLAWRTVEGNVRLPAEVFGDSEVLGRVAEAIETVGLGGFEKAYPRELSVGLARGQIDFRGLGMRIAGVQFPMTVLGNKSLSGPIWVHFKADVFIQ